MSTTPLSLLAFDLGAESGRAILGQLDNETLRLSEVHRFANTPVPLPDGLHWNALGLWNEIRYGLSKAVKETPDLASVGIDTWGVDYALLDRRGAMLGIPYHYRDGRTDGVVEAACQRVPREDIYAQTGIQFMQLNTLYQLYAEALHNSPQLAAAETFLTMPDLLNYWLTGRKVCEFTNATTTQCYDTRRRSWARPLLERLGIPTHIFPEIVAPGTVLGNLRSAVAEEMGLAHALPVVAPACHDTGSAVAAVPAGEGDFAWSSSGTWSIMGVEVRDAVVNERALSFGLTNEGGVNGTYRLSKNISGLWLVQECRRTWARQGHTYSYDELTRLAAEAQPLRSIIDPDADDFLKPGDMPARIRDYCQRVGQPVPESIGQIVRCALEGVALKYRHVLEALETLLGKRLDTIHIVGGGTQNRLLSQLAADACGRMVITGPIEATATGNLLMQAIALGEIGSLSQAREIVRRSFEVHEFTPDTALSAQWNDAYAEVVNQSRGTA